jgi:signal transduction histidine kinase
LREAFGAEEDKKIIFFRKAEEAGLESYNIAEKIGTIPVMKDACGILKEIYQKQEKYSEALQYSETFNSLNDSLLNSAKIEALTFAEARWNVEKKQQEVDNLENAQKLNKEIIQRKESETRQQRIIIWFIVALLILTLGLAAVAFLYLRKKRDILYQKQLANNTILRMQNIRNAISPHFTFNVLNNIWAIIDDRENARQQFDNLVNLIRRSLINTEKIAIPLNDEIDFVKSFTELQKFRLDNDLKVVWNIESGIDLNQLVPGMILQIHVENAIKHGLSPKNDNRILQIDLKLDPGYLQFTISDNGIGLQKGSSLTQGTGTGLKVLTNTIHILNQTNEKKMSYEIRKRDDEGVSGTKVSIKIPLKYNYNLN